MFSSLTDPGAHAGVGVSFTDRWDGVSLGTVGPLNLGRTDADDVEAVATNFDRIRERLGLSLIVATSQVHGADVCVVDETLLQTWGSRSHLGTPGGAPALPVADAQVTALPRVALCIRVADCVPVLLADTAAGVLGAAHAGRAGYLAGVLTSTVRAMHDLGASSIEAWIGPHVCGRCYEVPAEMADSVRATHPAAVSTTSWGTTSLDLGQGCADELAALGVGVTRVDPCTRETSDLHSHRRDGAGAGRLAGIIWRVSDAASPLTV